MSDRADLPVYVTEQLAFYRRTAATARRGYLCSEVVSIVGASSVPVAVAVGAGKGIIAGLGALAAVATGLRQAFNFKENWIMRAVAYESIKGDIAVFDSDRQARKLTTRVRAMSLAETARWEHVTAASSRPADQPDGASAEK